MDIGKIIRNARIQSGRTLKSVEKEIGIAASVQSKIELGDIPSPSFNAISRLAKLYNLSLDGIVDAIDNELGSSAKIAKCFQVPIISYCQAGEWTESVINTESFEMITVPFTCSPDSFALQVKGSSMTSTPGTKYSFPEGSYIIVDPSIEAHHGDFVVARLEGTNDATFKRLILDGEKYLQPLNPQYPVMEIDRPMILCGVVVGSIQKISD